MIIDLMDKDKKKIILYIKEHHYPYCSCGEYLEPYYEGEVTCPIVEKTLQSEMFNWADDFSKLDEAHQQEVYSQGSLDICQFAEEVFGITKEELKK